MNLATIRLKTSIGIFLAKSGAARIAEFCSAVIARKNRFIYLVAVADPRLDEVDLHIKIASTQQKELTDASNETATPNSVIDGTKFKPHPLRSERRLSLLH